MCAGTNFSQGNIKKALERVRQQISLPQAMVIWDVKEQRIVLKAYEKYGAHYHALRRTLKTKTWKDTLQYISRYLRMPNKYETNVLQPLQSVDGSRGKDLKTTTTTSSSSSSSLFERNLNTTANDSPVVDYFNLDKDETDSKVSNDQGNSAMHPDLQDDSMYFDMDQNSDLEDNASEFDVEEPSTAIGSNSQSNGNGSKRPSKTNATKNNIRFQQMLIK